MLEMLPIHAQLPRLSVTGCQRASTSKLSTSPGSTRLSRQESSAKSRHLGSTIHPVSDMYAEMVIGVAYIAYPHLPACATTDKTATRPPSDTSSPSTTTETAAGFPSRFDTASELTQQQKGTSAGKTTAISLSPLIHASGSDVAPPPIQPQDMPASDAHEASHNSRKNHMQADAQTQPHPSSRTCVRTSQPPLHKQSHQQQRQLPLVHISKLQRRPAYSRPVADLTELSSDDTRFGNDLSAPAHTSQTSASTVGDAINAAERLEQLSQKIKVIQNLQSRHSTYMSKLESHADGLRRRQAVENVHTNAPRFPTVGPVPWTKRGGVTQASHAPAKALKLEEAETDGMFRRLLDYGSDDSGQEATALSFSTRKGLPTFKREEDDSVLAQSGTPVSLRCDASSILKRCKHC